MLVGDGSGFNIMRRLYTIFFLPPQTSCAHHHGFLKNQVRSLLYTDAAQADWTDASQFPSVHGRNRVIRVFRVQKGILSIILEKTILGCFTEAF